MKITNTSVSKPTKSNGAAKKESAVAGACASQSDDSHPNEMIAVAAYFCAEQRGFAPGNELADWFQAEAEYKNRSSPHAD